MYDWTLYVVLDISTSIPGISAPMGLCPVISTFFAADFEL